MFISLRSKRSIIIIAITLISLTGLAAFAAVSASGNNDFLGQVRAFLGIPESSVNVAETGEVGALISSNASPSVFSGSPVAMASQPGLSYTEDFADIANWTNNFASGIGTGPFNSVAISTAGAIPDPNTITLQTTLFASGTAEGVQKGSSSGNPAGTIVLLATNSTSNTHAIAIDFLMDFTGVNAGKVSYDWSRVNNSTGDRGASLRVYASTDGISFSELTSAAVNNVINNGGTASGSISNVGLPASFNNSATARLRFYCFNGTTTGTTGSRPKISIDNLNVTATQIAPSTQASNLTFSSVTTNSMTVNWTNGDGSKRIVKLNTSNSFTAPTDGNDPIANSSWQNAGEQVVYNGASNNVSVTNLSSGTTYWARVYEANGSSSTIVFNTATATGNPNSQATLSTYTVSYNGNGNTGGTAPVDGNSPYAAGSWVGVKGPGDLVKSGFAFGGWNTAANGSGTQYNPAQSFAIASNTTLYAQWIVESCFVSGSLDPTFDGDGKLTTAVLSADDQAGGVAVQPDGKIVAAGYSRNGSGNYDFAIVRYNADGSLDTSFDGDGKVTTDGFGFDDFAHSVAIQPDGKIVVAGEMSIALNNRDFALVRYNADGSLDTSFDGDGKVTTAVLSGGDVAFSVAIQPDGKIVAAGISFNGSDQDFAVVRYNSDGSLDTSFDVDGKVTTAVLSSDDRARSVSIQPDGKIVAAGYSNNGSNEDFALVRYSADGSLDTSFDGDGKLTTAIFGGDDVALSAAVQPDGKIIAAGYSLNGSTFDFAVVRYNANGSLDTSFDGDGKVTTAVLTGNDAANSVVVQPDGKIVAAGYSYNGPNRGFAAVRYNADGSLDTAFDGDGMVATVVLGSFDDAQSVAIQPDGKIVAAGYSSNGSDLDFALVRYGGSCTAPEINIKGNGVSIGDGDTTPAVADDTEFGSVDVTTGSATHTFTIENTGTANLNLGTISADFVSRPDQEKGDRPEVANHFTVTQPVSSVVAPGGSTTFTVTFDPTSAGTHVSTINIANDDPDEDPYNFDVQGTGTISTYTVTYDGNANTGGSAPVDGNSYAAGATVTVLGNTGSLVKSGYVFSGWNTQADGLGTDYAPASTFNITGNTTLYAKWLPTFTVTYAGNGNNGGAVPVDPNNPHTSGTLVGVAGPGNLVKAGFTFNGWNTAANGSGTRYTPAQSFLINADTTLYAQWIVPLCQPELPDPTFDSDGKVTTSFGSNNEYARAVVVMPGGKIAAAGYEDNGTTQTIAVARYLSNGSLDTSFGGTGKVLTPFGASSDASGIAAQSDGKLIVAGSTWDGSSYSSALVRYDQNGVLDPTFNGTGKVSTTFGVNARASSLAIQPDGKIVVVGETSIASVSTFMTARYNSNGSLDTSFGGSGIVVSNPGGNTYAGRAVAIQPDGKIVAGGYRTLPFADADFTLIRYNADGTLDTSFGTGGIAATTIASQINSDVIKEIKIQADGKIVAIGFSVTALVGQSGYSAARFNANGTLDTSFAVGGTWGGVVGVGQPLSDGAGVILRPDGKIVYAATKSNGSNSDFYAAQKLSNGWYDFSFGQSYGEVFIPVGSGNDAAFAADLQADGRIVLAGTSSNGSNSDFALVRLGTCTPPEMDVQGNGQSIPDGDITPTTSDHTDFGSLNVASGTLTRTFTIANTGSGPLYLTGSQPIKVTVSGPNASDFVVNAQPSYPISGPSGTTTFQVTFDPSALGTRTATISIANNDSDEDPYDFVVQGAGAAGETSVAVSGNDLVITDVNGGSTNDNLTLTLSGSKILVSDPDNLIDAGAGCAQVDPHTVECSMVNFTGGILVNTLDGNDSLTVDLTNGDLIPPSGLTFNGGNPTSGPGDKLNIIGGSQGSVTYNYTNAHDGSVVMSNFGTITYTGLEPIVNSGTASNIIFNLPAGPVNAASLSDLGGGVTRLASSGTFETTDFANPSGSVTVNRGNATDSISVGALATNYPSLTIGNVGFEFGPASFTGAITFASGKSLVLFSSELVAFNSASSDIATSGSGSISLTTSRNLTMLSGSSMTSVNGDITVNANQQVVPTVGTYFGINLNNAEIKATGTGTVTVNGKGGTSGNSVGIAMSNSALIQGGTTAGALRTSVAGTGGSGSNVHGIQMGNGASITSGGGNVSVTGTGGSGAGVSHGIILFPAPAGGVITGGSGANVTVNGTGGSGGNTNVGILVDGSGSAITATGSGTVTVTGTGGAGASNGVELSRDGGISSAGTLLTVTGTYSGTGTGIYLNPNGNSTIGSVPNGTILLVADKMDLAAGSVTANAGGVATLRQKTNGTTIELGGVDSASVLSLTDSELDRVVTGTLNIGDANTGNVQVTSVITQTKTTNISTPVATVVFGSADLGIFGTVNNPLSVNPGGTLRPGASPGVINVNTLLSLGAGSNFAVEIGGTTPGNGAGFHDQVNVTGTVDVTDAILSLAQFGGFTPVAGQQYKIINNDGADAIGGTFAGLSEGATIAPFLVPTMQATISYVGGDGNDVVLTAVAPPSTINVSTNGPLGFGNLTVGNYSPAQSYDVSGVNLTTNLVVTAPANYEVSTSQFSGFGPSVSLTPSGGNVPTTTIWVRFVPGSAGPLGGNVTNTSTGAGPQNVSVIGTGVAAACTAAPANMVAWYAAEGNANDRFGLNNGSLTNGATATGTGKVGQAFSLDGNDDFVNVPHSSALNPGTGSFTVDTWVYQTGMGTFADQSVPFVNKAVGDFDNGWHLYVDTPVNGSKYTFLVGPSGGPAYGAAATGIPVMLNQWVHIAGVYDAAADTVSIYINGALAGTTGGVAIADINPTTDMLIGKYKRFSLSRDEFMPGLIDEVEIFNRALSGAEVAAIYNASTSGKCPTPDIVVEEPVGTGLVDGVSTINFGTQTVPVAGSPRTITVRNNGTTTLNVNVGSITIDGANSGDFSLNTAGMSPTIAPNGNTAFTVTFTPSAAGVRNAALHIPSDDPDENPFDIGLTGTGALVADLSITKSDGVATAVPGGLVTYTITASNAGPSTATGVTVADTFPAALSCTTTSVAAGGATGNTAGPFVVNINDSGMTMPAGSSVTYTATCSISAAATGTLSNTATVSSALSDPTPGNNSATDTDTLTPQADLAITKTDGVVNATPGGSVTYTITASNAGPSNAPGSTVADTFPASITAVNWTCVGAGGGTCPASGSGNISAAVNLPAGGSVTFTASATLSPSATGTLSNTATVAAGGGVTDPTPGNNSATDTDTLIPSTDVSITKTDGVTTAVPGGSVTYTITASNSGPSTATGVTVADTFPAVLTCSTTSVAAGGATGNTAGPFAGNISNSGITMPPGSSVTYTSACSISASATGTLSNTATVSSATTDPNPANNSATDTDTLTPQANLGITKTDGVTTVQAGLTTTYTITASNAGPSNAAGSTVADTLPAGIASAAWTCAGAGGGTCTASGSGNISDTVNLPAGGSVTYTVVANISIGASGSLSNTATVTAPGGVTDPTPGNNSATDTDTVNACVVNPIVTNNADDGVGSLRRQVAIACTGSTITFQPGPEPPAGEAPEVTSPITLTSGQIVINKDLTITGPGASTLTISGNNNSRIFSVGVFNFNMSGLTLTNGNGVGAPGSNNGGVLRSDGGNVAITSSVISGNTVTGLGGGIFNRGGTLSVTDSTISGNTASLSGAIENIRFAGDPVTVLTITRSTISGNIAGSAAGIHNQGATLIMNNSTVSGNIASASDPTGGGGGLENVGAGFNTNATLTGCTFFGNQHTASANPTGDEIYSGNFGFQSTVTLQNTIVGGSPATATPNMRVYTDGTIPALGIIASQGYNLSTDSGGGFLTGTADQINTDPLLLPLANNGGPTQTHALCAGAGVPAGCTGVSPAVDKGINALALPTDQRGVGFLRTVNNPSIPPASGGDETDIGAFEINNTPPTITPAVGVTRQQGSPASNSTIATVGDAETPVGSLAVTVTSANPSNGVTISNIVNTAGTITADVVAACGATNASFTLTVTDGGGLTTNGTLNVTVTANTAPVLTYTNPAAVVFGQSGITVNPATGPSDNGSVASVAVQSQGTYTGTVSVTPAGVVTLNGAAPVGTHTITIRATDNCGAFTDTSFQVTVNKANTTTALVSSVNPTVFGQSTTFTATISVTAPGAGTPTGTVTFKDNGVNIGTCATQPVAANVATCSISTLSVGSHPITSVYNGDANFNGSTSNTVNQVVNKADTTTSVVSSLNPSVFGQSVTFTATVAAAPPGAGTPTGTVSFNIDGNIYCPNTPLANVGGAQKASCTQAGLPALAAGNRVVVALYNGDANFNSSAGTLSGGQVVNKASTAIAITGDTPDPTIIGQPYTVSWAVSVTAPGAGTPTGTVTVVDGTGGTCSAPIAAGSCSLTSTSSGNKTLVATYNGDSNFLTSTSPGAAHTVNVQITGTVRQAPAMTPLSGVTVTLSGCAAATATTNAAGAYTFTGIYTGSCTVTPSGLGKIYDPISRTFSVANNVANADFTAYNSPADVPRTLTLTTQFVVPGDPGAMPVVLNSQDNEAKVAFSYSFDINRFAVPPMPVCGANAPGCTILTDTSILGRVGVTVTPAGGVFTKPDGTPLEGPEAAGPKEIAKINFQTLPTGLPSTPVSFVGTPVAGSTFDAANNPLLTTYVSGLIVFAQGLEGDVNRTSVGVPGAGDGAVTSPDVVQVRRIVTGLDTPDATGAPGPRYNEFQRADTSPSITKGNGIVDATDVIQVRRYAAGLDTPQSAGGPGQAVAGPIAPPAEAASGASREVVLGKANASTGSRVTVPVEMRANGDEMAASFSIRYDQTKLTNPTLELSANAPDGAVLTANTDEPGVIRVLIDSTAAFAPSSREPRQLVNVSFDVAQRAPTGDTTLEITDGVISDARANGLAARYTAGTVSISGPNALSVSISGRVLTAEGAGLRNAAVSITDASGTTRTVATGTFGYYRIEGVTPGREYTLTVNSRRYRFTAQKVTPGDNLADVDFTAQE